MAVIQLSTADAACGAKARGLARLIAVGLRVPDGFVVSGDADRQSVSAALAALGDVPVAVRSSGLGEDSSAASFAGQLETILGVRSIDEVMDAITQCSGSAGSPRARAYAAGLGVDVEKQVPVIVQRLVNAEVAGVAFSRDPRNGAIDVVIEASWGLGESVVGGIVTPDVHTVGTTGAVTSSLGSKESRVDLTASGLRRRPVADEDRRRFCLDASRVVEIAAACRQVEAEFGLPVDIEWAIADDELWLLQVRPITSGPSPLGGSSTSDAVLARGSAASPGQVSGTARIVRGPSDFGRFTEGDVLVCRTTDPAWTPLFGVAAAVVTEVGGILSHAAIVAREVGIPAVVGAEGVMAQVRDGLPLMVDGSAGTVEATS